MLAVLGLAMARRRRAVLTAALLFVAVAAAWGTGVFGSLVGGGFDDPGSESARAAAAAEDAGSARADVLLVYRSNDGRTLDDPSYRADVEADLAGLPPEQVLATATTWSTGSPALATEDGRSTYAVLTLAGGDEGAREEAYDAVADDLADAPPGLSVLRGGPLATGAEVGEQVGEDIARAELISLPVLLVLLVVVFGGLAAASLPLAIGALAVLGAFTALRVLTLVTEVSVFSVNIVTMLGLGLAVDYGLFVVSRFREELPRAASVEDAVARTMATAGRTVLVSGLTVATSLAGLLLFPQVFLRSMGLGGVAAVLVAMVAALTVLPALLAVLGPRVDALRVPGLGRLAARPSGEGAWARLGRAVMRRPVLYVAAIVPVLLLAGSPFLRLEPGGVDARVLPAGSESRVASEALAGFPGAGRTPLDVVVTGADQAQVPAYAERLAEVPGVTGVLPGPSDGGTSVLQVAYDADPQSARARDLVGDLRDVPAPPGAEALVGGAPAELSDLLSSLASTLPWMLLLIAVATVVLLFLAFGSLVLPVKAVLVGALSLSASFGAVVWVFQDGNLEGLLGFTSTGTVDATQPVLMFAIAFGLSMDYEVFLLSRVREQYDLTGDTERAVVGGLQRTGPIITSAALLLVVVVGAFSTSGVTFIKMIGVGLVIAIVLDATVVRGLLVPASMRLLGRANWWAPAPMARWWDRHGWREEGDVPPALPGPRSGARPAEEEPART